MISDIWPLAPCLNRLISAFNSPVFPRVTTKEGTPLTLIVFHFLFLCFFAQNLICVALNVVDFRL